VSGLRKLSIDAPLLARAQNYYTEQGYVDTPTPWLVGKDAYMATVPPGHEDFLWHSLDKENFHVASAEQGFIQMMLDGDYLPPKAQSLSPCYRGEPVYDRYHWPFFYKLELYQTDTSDKALAEMITCARALFESLGISTRVIATGERSYDIETAHTHIELGSYGYRVFRGHEWLYGTGLALPRTLQGKHEERAYACDSNDL
jgi:seryl-tRNA synthetase